MHRQKWPLLLMIMPSAAFVPPSPTFLLSSSSSSSSSFLTPSSPSSCIAKGAHESDSERFDDNDNYINNSTAFATTLSGQPFPNIKKSVPSKLDLYSSQDLQSLWDIHNAISSKMATPTEANEELEQESDNRFPSLSLHDMVLQEIQTIDSTETTQTPASSIGTETAAAESTLPDSLQSRLRNIKAIASDVDGTLLSSDHSLHQRTRQAVIHALSVFDPTIDTPPQNNNKPLFFFPATGKSRAGALNSLGTELSQLLSTVPGVFTQGLVAVNAENEIVFEQRLDRDSILAAEQLVKEYNITLFGYDGDVLYALAETSSHEHLLELNTRWGEPVPIRVESLADCATGLNKLIIMDDDTDKVKQVLRPRLEALADTYNCSVTVAIPTMLELLPAGCSKALGVQKMCEHLGIDPATELLAIGDAENDIGMLQMAAIGVAVGNALPSVKAVADLVLDETNDEGGAGAAIELVLSARRQIEN